MKPDRYQVKPDERIHLKDIEPDEHHFLAKKEDALAPTAKLAEKIDFFQERLFAEHQRSLLVVLQGMDTSGKDGTIRGVFTGINPQGCQVTSFKSPSADENAHDFLWRIHQRTPARGMIGVFNRSHYEDVGITRVHKWIDKSEAERRFKAIRHFEKHLTDSGTAVVKIFLHISKAEQAKRLQARADDPEKRWKFNMGDLDERKFWKPYRQAYEDAISATSTEEAPWYVVPADHKWYRNWVVASIVAHTLEKMKLKTPRPDARIDFKKIRLV